LIFESQRIVRERMGQYDFYATLEDDIIVHDSSYLEKLTWFGDTFGAAHLLQPRRIEVSKSGSHLGKVIIDDEVPAKLRITTDHKGPDRLTGVYHGKPQGFSRPFNPHSCCWFVSEEQLGVWVKHPTFYDLDTSWIDPLASAATRSLALTFDIFKPAAPDPFFLEVEHYGNRYANLSILPAGVEFGEDPLMLLARSAVASPENQEESATTGQAAGGQAMAKIANEYALSTQSERIKLAADNGRMKSILKSRSKTLKHLVGTLMRKPVR
jgi:hypothetical protein